MFNHKYLLHRSEGARFLSSKVVDVVDSIVPMSIDYKYFFFLFPLFDGSWLNGAVSH